MSVVLTFFSKDFPNGTKICDCNKGYDNFNNGICNYKLKTQITAFLLSFFLGPVGAEWYYVGDCDPYYNAVGVAKCIIFVLAIIFIFSAWCSSDMKDIRLCDDENSCIRTCGDGIIINVSSLILGMSFIAFLFVFLWYISDWIRIVSDPCNMKDPNDFCLLSL
jgi:hypothetical protein